jgi:precorrin-6B methylase 2
MAEISKSDKILHIGCGAIPYSLIIISNEINAEVIGIDNQPRSINLAKKFLTKYKIYNKIHVEIESGETYNVSNFDVILISYGIGNAEMVLKNVFNNLKKDGKILLRKSLTEKNDYVDTIIKKYSIKKKRLLLTQESVLIVKKS